MNITQNADNEIKHAMDRCRAGRTIVIGLPNGETCHVTAEKGMDDIIHTYHLTRADGSTTEVESLAVWNLISKRNFRMD
jgi:hypothetical protein